MRKTPGNRFLGSSPKDRVREYALQTVMGMVLAASRVERRCLSLWEAGRRLT